MPRWTSKVTATLIGGCALLGGEAVHVAKQSINQTREHIQALAGRKEVKLAHKTDRCMVHGETRRIAFFHIPKTGTSLGTVIAHYVNPSIPDDAVVPDCTKETCSHVPADSMGQLEFQYRYPIKTWFKDCLWEKAGDGPDGTDWFNHNKVPADVYDDFTGRFVGMFRDPKQRALSSFHSFAHMRVELYGIEKEKDWARKIEGTAVKMLAGQRYPLEALPGTKVTESSMVPDLKLALSRLDGFLFAGLVEHWELSVCLFHAVTGTKWGSHDVDNMRSLKKVRGSDEWDETKLKGYKDPYDTPLYLEVEKRFWLAVDSHHLTAEKCHKLCPEIDSSDFL
eukprot:TRINITY_DN1891_c0_g1_i6.p1 TRINITY_DN1891_c0_g1~~TRINITY_DN1891_c0_g1_i6.p1  ORF type:complete len:361 (+),score=39.82 TRINITY_DN1891_c0_g1_i6:74-1084(+)